jgi:AMP nucleosidase
MPPGRFLLARLPPHHTPVEHFQPFVLFTSYTRYVDEFVRWGCSHLDPESPYIALLRGRDLDHR